MPIVESGSRLSLAERRRDARRAANEVRSSMGRADLEPSRAGLGAPLRAAFFADGEGRHPLAELMSSPGGRGGGGRGGRTRLALLISILWIASGEGHSSTRPASFWARLLGLDDPGERGARAINATWAELDKRGFIRLRPGAHAGAVSTITLLNEASPSLLRPYEIPKGSGGDLYVRIPESFWTSGQLADPDLTGPGLAMYLIALRTYQLSRNKESLTFPAPTFKVRYGLSEATRKKGLANLEEIGVLDRVTASVDDSGGIGHRLRRRNVYQLAGHLVPPEPRPRETTP